MTEGDQPLGETGASIIVKAVFKDQQDADKSDSH